MAARAAVLLAFALALFGEARAVDRGDAFIGYSETTRPDSSAIALRTSVGDIVVRLRDDISPRTARYFREFASARWNSHPVHRARSTTTAAPVPLTLSCKGGSV